MKGLEVGPIGLAVSMPDSGARDPGSIPGWGNLKNSLKLEGGNHGFDSHDLLQEG